MSTFPESLYRLLALIDSHPSRQVRFNDIPEELRDALQIGRHYKLIESTADDDGLQMPAYTGGNREHYQKALRQIAEIRNKISENPSYSLTSAGRCELAMYREKSTQVAPVAVDPVKEDRGITWLVEQFGLLDEDGAKVLHIAQREDLTVGDKLGMIYSLKPDLVHKKQKEMADLLGVTAPAISKCEQWRDRKDRYGDLSRRPDRRGKRSDVDE